MTIVSFDKQEKISGCLLGGAIGDALGAPVEFLRLSEIRRKFGEAGITDFHAAYGKAGAITDDTQMLLFTAEGMLRGWVRQIERGIGGAEVEIVGNAYLRWLKTQTHEYSDNAFMPDDGWLIQQQGLWSRRAPGNACLSGLGFYRDTGKLPENDSKGCGTVMRVAPVGILFEGEMAYRFGKAISELTHGHPTASISAGCLAYIISLLYAGEKLHNSILMALKMVEKDERELGVEGETSNAIKTAIKLAESDARPSPELIESMGGGWVAEEALAISLYCALVAADFMQGVLLAVNHSGDSDSTGAITGNLLGLIMGRKAIPQKWLEGVELYDVIAQIADDLHNVPRLYFADDGSGDEHDSKYIAGINRRFPGC